MAAILTSVGRDHLWCVGAILVVVANLLVDIVYGLLDPRVSVG